MEIVTPGIGLIFWTSLLFLLVLVVLGKVAFKPIAKALKSREDGIEQALIASSEAKQEVDSLKEEIERMKQEARAEREQIIKEAKDNASKIIAEAQDKAKDEGARIIEAAHEAINSEKNAALAEVRKQVADLSIQIAEKVLRKELADDDAQKKLVNQFLDEVSSN